jgi:DNA-binding beta-propeller fold protein YncE
MGKSARRFSSITLLLVVAAAPLAGQSRTAYRIYVASEATDRIAVVRFDGDSARVVAQLDIGINPMDPDGPHGLGLAPDGGALFVTTAHGSPFGHLWKLDRATGRILGRTELGNFPASLQPSPDGRFVYAVNFNLHGDMVPSSLSVVSVADMVEVARIQTCAMPHGSRFNAAGTLHYSTCMMDDMLIEVDTRTLGVARHFMLAGANPHGMPGPPRAGHTRAMGGGSGGGAMGGMEHAHGDSAAARSASCSPTWAAPGPDGSRVYVACNRSNEIVEVDAATWRQLRRLPAGEGVYNLAITRDGRTLVATNKRGQSVSLFDIATGRETARIATRRRIVHGVAITPDDRYACVSVEGIGSEPGTLEIIDLVARRIVASVDVGQMAGGIDVLTEP